MAKVRPCERQSFLCFVVSQNMKQSNYRNSEQIQNKTGVCNHKIRANVTKIIAKQKYKTTVQS